MKSEIEKIGAQMRGEKVGIETLKQIQKVKAKIIKQAVETYTNAINHTLGGFVNTAFSWVDEAIALGNVLGKYKKIGAEWQDLDGEEAKELQAHFIVCLKEQGFNSSDEDMLEMAIKINDYVMLTTNFFKEMAEHFKK